MRQPNNSYTSTFLEDLHRNSKGAKDALPFRNDPQQQKWLAERRFEQEHVKALAEKHMDLEQLFDKAQLRIKRTDDYVRALEREISKLRTTYGTAGSTSNDGRVVSSREQPQETANSK